MRKFLFVLIFSLILISGFDKVPQLATSNYSVNKVLEDLKTDKDFKNAGFGFLAISAQTGEVISSYNPDMALKPASNLKLLSTASILELFGPDFMFDTKLQYTGVIDTITHVLHGDIIIKGGGDPTLGSKYFDQTKDKQFLRQWTDAIKHIRIDSIAGAVIADATVYSRDIVPLSWSWINMGNYFGAGACGLSIYDNYYTIYFNTKKAIGSLAEIEKISPVIPFLVFDNNIVASKVSEDKSNIIGAPYSNTRYLRGELPLGKTNFEVKGSLPDPAYFAAYELDRSLKESDITIKNQPASIRILENNGKSVSDVRKEITATYSPPLSEIVAQTNIRSINLFAEHLLNHCGLKLIGKAETEPAAKAIMEFWKEKGMDIEGMTLTDGSGLSQYDAVTPNQMVFLLNYMRKHSPYFDVYYNSLPLAGQEGHLEGMFKGSPAEWNLRAKSGAIDRVKAYSGYVKSRSGEEIIFSMIVNNFSCTSEEARAKLERLMIALSEVN